MDDALVLDLCRRAFVTSLLVSGPLLLTVLVVGLVASIVQAMTQVQEATLTFLPKLLAVGVVLVMGGGWMLQQLLQFAGQLLGDFRGLAR